MPLYFQRKPFATDQKWLLLVIALFFYVASYTQTSDTTKDIQLTEVTVKAFEQNRKLQEVPASVSYISKNMLERFSSASVVQAINTMPGVRMEERSPGSYRFNIRGSSLRSPFGVRNIKIYYNDIPYTDPGGQTYLNQLGYYNFNSVEIIKGPGSSLYGAGTGGVLLINSLGEKEKVGVSAEYSTGSYQLQNLYGEIITGKEKVISRTSFQHQQNNGYRNHSALQRDILSWSGSFGWDSTRHLQTSFLYGDLQYETPGALTLNEYENDPKQSRPGNATFPGAAAARAAIYQRTFLAGVSYTQMVTKAIQGNAVLYGAYTQLRNPAIQNYGRNSEPHVGGRSLFKWTKPFLASSLVLDAGAEWQQGFGTYSIHTNKQGQPDSLRAYNEVNNRQSFVFAQAALDSKHWLLIAGISSNQRLVRISIFDPTIVPEQTKKYTNELAPRIALMKKWNRISAYTTISKGFSPPTTEELFPTGGELNLDLQAESGVNYDIGLRGQLGDLSFDINGFYFSLNNTIVQRRTAGGGSFFVNAGETDQKGFETQIQYRLFTKSLWVNRSIFWLSHTWHRFQYKEFKQLNVDFSDNDLPGVAPHSLSSGIDLQSNKGWLGTLTYFYNASMPLNDANTSYADAFHVLGIKLGYQKGLHQNWLIKLAIGIDNILDTQYSLGNDINGFGGRYYNAAPGRNWYATIRLQWFK